MRESTPASAGDVILNSFRTVGASWREMLKLGLVASFPVTVAGLALLFLTAPDGVMDIFAGRATDPNEFERVFESVTADEWVRTGIAWVVFLLASSAASVLAMAGCMVIAVDRVQGREPRRFMDALRAAWQRFGSFLWVFTLAGLGVLLGLVLCVLPGLWLLTSWSVAPVARLVEDRRGRAALRRSRALVKPAFWRVALVLLLGYLASFVLQGGLNAVVPSTSTGAGGIDWVALGSWMVVSSIVGLFALGLYASISVELYFHLVQREEPVPVPPTPPPGL